MEQEAKDQDDEFPMPQVLRKRVERLIEGGYAERRLSDGAVYWTDKGTATGSEELLRFLDAED